LGTILRGRGGSARNFQTADAKKEENQGSVTCKNRDKSSAEKIRGNKLAGSPKHETKRVNPRKRKKKSS